MLYRIAICTLLSAAGCLSLAGAEVAAEAPVEGQPLAANGMRLVEALEFLGAPLPTELQERLRRAAKAHDADEIQRLIDARAMFVVSIDAEAKVHVERGSAVAVLQQAGFTAVIVKVINPAGLTDRLRISSPQSGPVYAGVAELSMKRQRQESLRENENTRGDDRFLQVEMYAAPPMKNRLSGLEVEYAIALIYAAASGKREATIAFELGSGEKTASRGETKAPFDVRAAVPVALHIADDDGSATIARLQIRDSQGRVYPLQPKRLAPDLFFQPHIYRGDEEVSLLPPGEFNVEYGRGPEYLAGEQRFAVHPGGDNRLDIQLQRWVDPAKYGFYSGDHHIHGAGCAHYTSPTEGVSPADMFRQVKGEGLNVGAVLTWGPCFDFQRQFFSPGADEISEPLTLLKYDLEISGFGSQSLGHVCLLNLTDQTYPGSEGTATKGWPTWTTPVMRWAKEQGGVTGYAHSASGLHIDPDSASGRLLARYDVGGDGSLSGEEAKDALLPASFAAIDADGDGLASKEELIASHRAAADKLPNLAVPEMNGVGAMETCVAVSEGVCDFISAMDTPRIQEWNTWYHILNCGFPLKVSGETDFPCMSGRNVGQGRVYVRLGEQKQLDYGEWCRGLAAGRSYVSDGYAHALQFSVNGVSPGEAELPLVSPTDVTIRAKVAFAREMPLAVAHGGLLPQEGRRVLGDTVDLHAERSEAMQVGGERLVEVIVNGQVAASANVPADGQEHDLEFVVPIARSSWVALRQFPQLHTNPVEVIVGAKPIRASGDSARWCIACIELLWKNRENQISVAERPAAKEAFARALAAYRRIAGETAAYEARR